MSGKPYNPLDKKHLAESIVRAILNVEVRHLSDTGHLVGAGVYVIYYTGSLSMYAPVAKKNRENRFEQPIYVGKAIPKGGRKGGLSEDSAAKGSALKDRLGQHLASITAASNLSARSFFYQALVVDDIWIPLGENMLIEQYKPVWNRVIDGFGNKDPGAKRRSQRRSPWDLIHPGRLCGEGPNPRTPAEIRADLKSYFRTGVVPRRLKAAASDAGDAHEDE